MYILDIGCDAKSFSSFCSSKKEMQSFNSQNWIEKTMYILDKFILNPSTFYLSSVRLMKYTKLPQTRAIITRNRREGEMGLDVVNCF